MVKIILHIALNCMKENGVSSCRSYLCNCLLSMTNVSIKQGLVYIIPRQYFKYTLNPRYNNNICSKDVVIKINLLLYRIRNGQNNM